jgi:hypothetical protein
MMIEHTDHDTAVRRDINNSNSAADRDDQYVEAFSYQGASTEWLMVSDLHFAGVRPE